MVDSTSPHAYRDGLFTAGGSPALLEQIRSVDDACQQSRVEPVYTLMHLCVLARVSYKDARNVLREPGSHYKARSIVKRGRKNGRQKIRVLHEPSPTLKALQQAIFRNCLPAGPSSPISYAFETGRSTFEAAKLHVGAKSLVSVDVSDFFGSIRATGVFHLFSRLGYPELLSYEMALLTTVGQSSVPKHDDPGMTYRTKHVGALPQGAATSGKLANLLCSDLDLQLMRIRRRWGAVVTRYADDICLTLPRRITRAEGAAIHGELEQALESCGFRLNRSKTRIVLNAATFNMLGLCVGQDKVWLRKSYKQMVRAHLHGIEKFGLSAHMKDRNYSSEPEVISSMWGHYAYSAGIEPKFAAEIDSRLKRAGILPI
jgi:RNA-directed DNA polymerase